MSKNNSESIDLGRLQASFESANKKALADERALKRAQDARDSSRVAAAQAEGALRDGTRAVLG